MRLSILRPILVAAFSIAINLLLSACTTGGGENNQSLQVATSLSNATYTEVTYGAVNATLNLHVTSISNAFINNFTTVNFYADAACSTASIGTGTVSQFQNAGISVTVPNLSTTVIYVQPLGGTCVYDVTFPGTPNDPLPPIFVSSIPTSPSRTSITPVIIGQTSVMSSTILFFSDAACKDNLGSGSSSDFTTNGIQISVLPNQSTTIYAQLQDARGKKSICVLLMTYIHDSSAPNAPVFTSISPSSPSNTSDAPTITGTTTSDISSVSLFSDAACTMQIGSDTAANFAFPGIVVPVADNATTLIYAKGQTALGVWSLCGYMTTFTNDTIAPVAPTFAAANPASPTRMTIYPVLTGTVSSDTARVVFYKDSLCHSMIGSGTGTQYQAGGISVAVIANASTDIYATAVDSALNASACTHLTTYVNDTIAPDPPLFLDTNPMSPNNKSMTPLVQGTATSDTVTVTFYNDMNCTNILSSGTASAFEGAGIVVPVASNATTSIYATAADNLGNTSACVLFLDYAYSTAIPPAPVFSSFVPPSPSRTSNTPYIIGTVNSKISSVGFFSDSACTTQLSSGSAIALTGGGVQVPLQKNTVNSIYAEAFDKYGNTSLCVALPSYTHDNIPPADPTFVSVTPLSPNNLSSTPKIVGTAPIDAVKVNLSDDSNCQNKIGTGTGTLFTTTGIAASVAFNNTTYIYAQTVDAAGNNSNCIAMTSYVYDILKPGVPAYVSVSPKSPSYTQLTNLKGTIATNTDLEPVTAVNVYSDSGCTSFLASGAPAVFKSTGIPILALENTTTTFYVQTEDAVTNVSACTLMTTFVHSDIGPSGLQVSQGDNGSAVLSWSADANATSYLVKRSTKSGGPYTIINPANFGSSFVDNDVANGVTYYYVVASQNATGISFNSAEASLTISTTAPLGFSNVPPTLIPGAAQVMLSWYSDSTQMIYTVFRATQSGGPYTQVVTGLYSPNYTDMGLINGQPYYYVILVSNPGGNSSYSPEASTVPLDNPPAPLNMTAIYKNGVGMVLSWSGPSYYSQFQILRGNLGSMSIYATVSGTTFTYTDTHPLQWDTQFYYHQCYGITATWGTTASTYSNTYCFALDQGASLAASAGNNAVNLSWSSLAIAQSYQVLRSTTPGGPYITLDGAVVSTSYIDNAAVNGNTYYYVVVANYANALYGQPSAEVNATPMANPSGHPSNLIVVDSNYSPILSWTSPAQYDSFNVYRATAIGGPYNIVNAGPQYTNNFVDSTAAPGPNYYYVTANWGSFETAASNTVSYSKGYTTSISALGSATQVRVTWADVQGAVSYELRRSTVSGGPYSTVVSSAAVSPYYDTSVATPKGYYYVVVAKFSDGTFGQLSAEAAATAGATNIPSGLTVTQVSSNSANLVWTPIAGATSYKVYYGTTSGGPYTLQGGTAITFPQDIVTGLIASYNYYFVVSAVVGGIESSKSSEVSMTAVTLSSAPIVLAGNNNVTVTWDNCGAASYVVQRSTDQINFTTLASGLITTSYLDTAAVNGNQYFYRFAPVFTGATPFYSPLSLGVTPGVVPPAPQGLLVTLNNDGTDINLSWGDVSGATGFNIYQANAAAGPYTVALANTDSPPAMITGLSVGTKYYFKVSSLIGNVESTTFSNVISVTPMSTPAAPAVRVITNSAIAVTWSNPGCGSSSVVSYDVQRSPDTINFYTIASGVVTTNYSDSSAATGVSYTYRYLPYCTGSIVAAVSSPSVAVTLGEPPLAPQNLFVSSTSGTSALLTWAPVPEAVTYSIYRGSASGGPYAFLNSSTATSFSNVGLAAGSYFYVVTATNSSGDESSNSNEGSVNLSLAAPAGLAAVGAANVINLSWSTVAAATTYTVKRSLNATGPFGIVSSSVATTSYADRNIIVGQIYYYVVDANKNGLSSADSNVTNGVATTSINLQVPIELTDQALASGTSSITFARTQTTLDTSAYDGTVTYALEANYINGSASSYSLNLVNSANSTVATLALAAGTTQSKRVRVAFTPTNGLNTYLLVLPATGAVGDVKIMSARILVTQVGASKTKIYIPLLSSSQPANNFDSTSPIENTSSLNFVNLSSASIFNKNSSAYSTINRFNGWEIEALVSASSTVTGAIALYDTSQSSEVANTETQFTGAGVMLITAPFDEGDTFFAPANDGDSYQLTMKCELHCDVGSVSLYKAGLWVSLNNLTHAEIPFRNALAVQSISVATALDSERTLINLANFSNPVVNYQSIFTFATGTGVDINLQDSGINDSGVMGTNVVLGSDLNMGSSSSYNLLRTLSPVSFTSGDRFLPYVNPGAGGVVNFNSSSILVDISP